MCAHAHPCPPAPSPLQLGLGDDQHRSGYEAALDPWLAQLWPALRRHFPLPPGATEPAPTDTATELVCKYRVTWLTPEEAVAAAAAAAEAAGAEAAANGSSASSGSAWGLHQEALAAAAQFDAVEAAASGLPPAMQQGPEGQPSSRAAGGPATTAGDAGGPGAAGYGPHRPYWARLASNRRITAPTHLQDVRQLDVDLADSGLTFQPGDVLAVVPQQPAAAVDALLRRCGWGAQAWVRVEPAAAAAGAQLGAANGSSSGSCSATVRLGALIAGALDINGASPRRFFFQVGRPWWAPGPQCSVG